MRNLVERELSYQLTGISFEIHNLHGRFLTEKQYTDLFESKLSEKSIVYTREKTLNAKGIVVGRPDFVIDGRVILDIKAKKFITKQDYNQMMKYLTLTGIELGLIINFRSTYLKPKRVLNYLMHSEHSDAN